MASLQFTRLSLTLTGAGTLPEATDGGGSTQFLAHRPIPVFANAWSRDRSHRRSSIASLLAFWRQSMLAREDVSPPKMQISERAPSKGSHGQRVFEYRSVACASPVIPLQFG